MAHSGIPPRRALRLGLPALICLALAPGWAGAASDEGAELAVLVAAAADDSGARVTLTFSRPVDYRLRESRSRLRLLLDEPVSEASRVDRRLEGDVVRRIRLRRTSRGAEVVFHLGRRFASFSSMQRSDPFRVVLTFVAPGASPPAEEPPAGLESGAPRQGPPGRAGQEPPRAPAPWAGWPAPGAGRFRVVIDPGHGGSEGGAVSSGGLREKDLVLDIARRLRAHLQELGCTVALTRNDDRALDLTQRAALANKLGADLFLSIHANSSRRPAARGAETYFLSYGSSDERSLSLARQENRPEGGSQERPGAAEEIDLVLWEMAQARHLNRSSGLADLIQAELNELAGTRNRGVKQAPFRVLAGAAMPAVLVEVGFLSNGEEAASLATLEYRDRVAAALAAAVERFRRQVQQEGEPVPAAPSSGPR